MNALAWGEEQVKRFRQNYPLSWWKLFNLSSLSLLTPGTDLAPTGERITSEKLILLVWVKDF